MATPDSANPHAHRRPTCRRWLRIRHRQWQRHWSDGPTYLWPAFGGTVTLFIAGVLYGLVGGQHDASLEPSALAVTAANDASSAGLFAIEFRARALWLISATAFWTTVVVVYFWAGTIRNHAILPGRTSLQAQRRDNDATRHEEQPGATAWRTRETICHLTVIFLVLFTYLLTQFTERWTYPVALCHLRLLSTPWGYGVVLVVGFMWPGGLMCVVRLVSTICALVRRVSAQDIAPADMTAMFARTRMVLYMAATLLAAAVLEIAAVYHWVAIIQPTQEHQNAYLSIAKAVSLGWGLLFTLLLAAIFAPTIAIQIRVADALGARYKPNLAWRDRRAWLLKEGLRVTTLQEIKGVSAVIGPAIAGSGVPLLIDALA